MKLNMDRMSSILTGNTCSYVNIAETMAHSYTVVSMVWAVTYNLEYKISHAITIRGGVKESHF